MENVIYTFRTCREVIELVPDIFIFSRLNEDMGSFLEIINTKQPRYIIGIGNGPKTQYETKTINKFGKSRSVNKDGLMEYPLFVPMTKFKRSDTVSTSFCNWSTYKIAHHIYVNRLSSKTSFIHLSPNDAKSILPELREKF